MKADYYGGEFLINGETPEGFVVEKEKYLSLKATRYGQRNKIISALCNL